MRHSLLLCVAVELVFTRMAFAADEPDTAPAAVSKEASILNPVEVSANLDKARNQLSTEIGASEYVLDSKAIEQLPLGDATPLNQMLLQAPGVVQDAFGELHVRGDHGDLQYRINGVILPESIGEFGQTLDPDIVQRMQLLTGALPAQYGYRTGGIVEITTENGAAEPEDEQGDNAKSGGRLGLFAGSFGTFNPELSVHGASDQWSYFITGDYLSSNIGIENPTSSRKAIHDHSEQLKGFGYVSYLFNEDTRLAFMAGATNSRFEIPDRSDQPDRYALSGVDGFDSRDLNDRQREMTSFGVMSLQGKIGISTYQVSVGQRYTSVDFHPDPIGDLIFHGVAASIDRSNRANTLQADVSAPLFGGTHTLRYGVYCSDEKPVSDTSSLVFPADAQGNQTSTTPIAIVDDAPHIRARTYGVYAQDEWQFNDRLTLNYGVRADRVEAFVDENQISPRLGLVYQASESTTLHAGYARYFTPPPTELISSTDIALFQGTTRQVLTNVNAETLAERSHYFDAGASQKIGALTIGLDAYYRKVHNLLDEGQFGAAMLFSPFNYAQGRVRGVELSANYTQGDFSAYMNVAASRAVGKNVITGQYNFGQDELSYVATHWVHLDHDQRLTGSGGVSYDWDGTKFSTDFLYGSGLRRGFANTAHLPQYWQINASAARHVDLWLAGKANVRIALINVTDRVYEIRDGSGIGVSAPQFGPRRGAYVILTKTF